LLEPTEGGLGIGSVGTSGQASYFRVTKQQELFILREILEAYQLNSTKYLNYLAFYKALDLYTKTRHKTTELLGEILTIKNSMNTNRSNFELPKSKKLGLLRIGSLGFWKVTVRSVLLACGGINYRLNLTYDKLNVTWH